MNWMLYAVLAGLLVGQVLMWIALFHLWRAGHSQQRVLHHVLDSLLAQTKLNTAIHAELELLNKAMRRAEAAGQAVVTP